jgi:hypothetical protein
LTSWVEPGSWAKVLAASERVDFRLDDVLPEETRFDFRLPFLPDAMTGASSLAFLNDHERRLVGHLRAHGYLGLFGVIEEMILPFVLGQTKVEALDEARALLRFASEEAKHIELFRRFSAAFARQFRHPARLVGPADAFARAVLAHSELAVALAVLQIEWMTQRHWLECVRGDESLEPSFKRLLRFHWMEEAQHARLDAMLVQKLAGSLSVQERAEGVEGYVSIVRLMDGALAAQVELDLACLEEAIERPLTEVERGDFRRVELASMRKTFLLDGMTHPEFIRSLTEVAPGASELVRYAGLTLR